MNKSMIDLPRRRILQAAGASLLLASDINLERIAKLGGDVAIQHHGLLA